MSAYHIRDWHNCRWLLVGCSISAIAASGNAQSTASPGLTATPATAASTSAVRRINSSGRVVEVVVPVRERVPLGQVTIRIAPDDQVSVSQIDLAAALGRAASPQFIAALKALPAKDGYLSLDQAAANGLKLSFDPAALELAAKFDVSARPERDLDFRPGEEAFEPVADDSSGLSALLSYQGSWDLKHRGAEKGLRAPRVDFDFVGRLFNQISFENQFSYDGNQKPGFTRFASRLVYDRPGSMLRFAGGDLFAIPTTFQDQTDIAGFGVSKLLAEFRPNRLFTASAGRRLTLNEQATVTILVNGAPARTISLEAGTYNLEDLPLTGGANSVELVIEDQAGGRRLVSFDFFSDEGLLAPGVDEFDAQIGIRSEYEDGKRQYFSKEGIVSGFYRRGLSDQLTAGANLQATRRRQQAGVEATLGTSLGLFTGNIAVSRLQDFGSGYAARLQYRHSTPLQQISGARRFDLLAEYRSENFGGVETDVPVNGTAWLLSGRYSQPVSDRLALGLGGDYRIGRNGNTNRYAVRSNATYRLGNGMTLNASAGYERQQGFNIGASLFWRFGRSTLVTAQYDSRLNDASVAYFHSPTRLLDSVAWNVEATRSEGLYGMNATAIWRTNRGDFELAHRASVAGGENDQRTMVSSLRARGSIAFADGQFAIGRYMTDSFAIVSGHRSLNGAQVVIGNRISDQSEARTGTLGPALVSLSSYSRRNLYFNVPDAPAGYDFGTGNIELYPWLHSGHGAVVGSEFNVTLFGTLVDEQGEPVSLIAGTARRIGDNRPGVSIFTNRQGRMGASGLAPGRWQIEAGNLIYEVLISEEQGSFVDVQTLRPTGRREKSS